MFVACCCERCPDLPYYSQGGNHAIIWCFQSRGRYCDAQVRAVHVIAGLDVAHGGPSYSVPRLCEALAATGMETTLLSVAGVEGSRRESCDAGYTDRRFAWDYAHLPVLRGCAARRGCRRRSAAPPVRRM